MATKQKGPKALTPQKPKTMAELVSESQRLLGHPVLEVLVDSGLPPATLDSFATKKLGLPNSVAKLLRTAAYLRDQYPETWAQVRQVLIKGVEVSTPAKRMSDTLFGFAVDEKLPRVYREDGQDYPTRPESAVTLKYPGTLIPLTAPVMLRHFRYRLPDGQIFTTLDKLGAEKLWHGRLFADRGYWSNLDPDTNSDSDLGCLETHESASGDGIRHPWHWHGGEFIFNKTADWHSGIRIVFNNLIEDCQVEYQYSGDTEEPHIVPHFAHKVQIIQRIPRQGNGSGAVNRVTYKGFMDNHPGKACTDGFIVFERIVPWKTWDYSRLTVQAVYEICGCEGRGHWYPVLLSNVLGMQPCIHHAKRGVVFRSDDYVVGPVSYAEAERTLVKLVVSDTTHAKDRLAHSRNHGCFDLEAVFGYDMLEHPERDLLEVFTKGYKEVTV